MDVEAVDEGENSDRPVSENVETGKGQEQNMTVNLAEREVNNQNGDAYRKPQVGMLFESEDAAKSFYNAYARHVGFSTHVGQFNRAKPDGPIITWDFACSREVFKRKNITIIPLFFRQYERSLEHSLEKEIEADYETICNTPVLKTPSPMEQQAANMYTKKIFAKFQEELVETFAYTANNVEDDGVISKYRVAKYVHDHKAYMVTLNISEMKVNCSCQMNAKSDIGTDEKITDPIDIENLTVRFNSLCREAIKLAEEGAVSVETYNATMNALREGAKRVGIMKKNVAKVTPPNTQGNGSCLKDHSKNSPSSISDVIPSLWPWQDSVSHHFNLNDLGLPVTDLNTPSMAPVSIHRDGCPYLFQVYDLDHLK
uniref:Protein FAR1-RELATED SEQUENCE n=1 Tax=Glycine max TaxID=3847 RepID=A0A0R0G4L3_SOYBN